MAIIGVIFLALIGLFILAVLYGVGIYNKLVKLKNLMQEAWSGVDVQLKKRYDLIPNLVETVKGYAKHEKETFENVTNARSRAMKADTVAEQAMAEQNLQSALINIYAVAENYPELKANENFLQLQSELSKIEGDIEMARRYYNGTVRDNNVAIESFPSNIVAGMFKFGKGEFFELDSAAERERPNVSF